MNAQAEAFLRVSRAYLFAPLAQDTGGAKADLAARAYPSAPRRARSAKRREAAPMRCCAFSGAGADQAEPW